jgi:hypothetical protein
MAGKRNVFCIPAQAVCSGLVQVIAEDLAGNQTTRQEHVSRLKAPTTEASNTQTASVNPPTPPPPLPPPPLPLPLPVPDLKTPGPAVPKELPKTVTSAPLIGAGDTHQVQRIAPAAPERPSLPRPDGSQGPRWVEEKVSEPAKTSSEKLRDTVVDGGLIQAGNNTPKIMNGPSLPSVPAAPKNAPTGRQLVNSAKVYLDYQIENAAQANVARVEVWMTCDQGQSWQKHSDATGQKSPIEVVLPGDGVYGLTLVASNGASAAVPPVAGDQPDGWIEVDTTKPALQINDIQTSHDKGQATVQIRWTAQDKNLADAPVDLFYAATPKGPWLLIAKGLPAAGQHRWTPPAGLGAQTHMKLEARDAAGNTSVCGTLEPVSIAPPAPPRAVIRTISTGLGGPQTVPQQ